MEMMDIGVTFYGAITMLPVYVCSKFILIYTVHGKQVIP